eukprot:SAG31_NODE_16050_length_725_cov_1.392971_1_plen_70_part_01
MFKNGWRGILVFSVVQPGLPKKLISLMPKLRVAIAADARSESWIQSGSIQALQQAVLRTKQHATASAEPT